MFVESYCDESGIHNGAQVCIVAGFYGTQPQWRKFEREWWQVLRDNHLEEHGFHAKRFWARRYGRRVPPYEGWTDAEADKYIDHLVQAVMRNRIFPFGHGIVVSDRNKMSLDERRWLTGAKYGKNRFITSGSPNKPYYVPFLFCVLDSLRYCGTNERVDCFAGLDKTFSKYATVLYQDVMNDARIPNAHRLGEIGYPLSKHSPALQASDLLVYQLYQFTLAKLRGFAKKPAILRRLLKNRLARQSFRTFRTEELRELIETARRNQ